MGWFNKLFKKSASDAWVPSTDPLNTSSFLMRDPPWTLYPEYPPGDGFWRQSGEYILHYWTIGWQALLKAEREAYLKKWSVPLEWRQNFFDRSAFLSEWAYGISFDNAEDLLKSVFAQLIGKTATDASFIKDGYLCIEIDSWRLQFRQAAWQLIKMGMLEAAFMDDPSYVEAEVTKIKETTIESIRTTGPFYDMEILFSNGFKLCTFTSQAVLDMLTDDQWELFMPDDKVIRSGPGGNLRYEISSQLSL